VAATNKDGTARTPSLRTLGTGAQQAMRGNAKIRTSQLSRAIPAVRVLGVQQTIPTAGAPTVLNFEGELYDTAALHKSTTDTSRLTAPVAGVYRISVNVSWPLGNSIGYREVRLVATRPGGPRRALRATVGPASRNRAPPRRRRPSTSWRRAITYKLRSRRPAEATSL
jgi:hypothetical protein